MARPPLDYGSEGAFNKLPCIHPGHEGPCRPDFDVCIAHDPPKCLNMFHSQLCHGFGAPEFCPECGGSWTWEERRRAGEPDMTCEHCTYHPALGHSRGCPTETEEPCPHCGFTGPYDGHVCEEVQDAERG